MCICANALRSLKKLHCAMFLLNGSPYCFGLWSVVELTLERLPSFWLDFVPPWRLVHLLNRGLDWKTHAKNSLTNTLWIFSDIFAFFVKNYCNSMSCERGKRGWKKMYLRLLLLVAATAKGRIVKECKVVWILLGTFAAARGRGHYIGGCVAKLVRVGHVVSVDLRRLKM